MKIVSDLKISERLSALGDPLLRFTLSYARENTSFEIQGASLHRLPALKSQVAKVFKGQNILDQAAIDQDLASLVEQEGQTALANKVSFALSLAVACSAAKAEKQPLFSYIAELLNRPGQALLPIPSIPLLQAKFPHALSVPIKAWRMLPIGLQHFREAVQAGSEVLQKLQTTGLEISSIPAPQNFGTVLESELESIEVGFSLLLQAINQTRYALCKEIGFSLLANTEAAYDQQAHTYHLSTDQPNESEPSQVLTGKYASLIAEYPIFAIEDGLDASDWPGFVYCTDRLGDQAQIVGNALIDDDSARLRKAVDQGAANAVRLNAEKQPSLTHLLKLIEQAQAAQYAVILSGTAGVSCDALEEAIADIVVATGAGQIQLGPLNGLVAQKQCARLIEIERLLGPAHGSYASAWSTIQQRS